MPQAMTLQELIDKRANRVHNMRQVIDKAKAENREPTDAEQTELDGWHREAMDFDTQIKDHGKKKKNTERDAWLKEQEENLDKNAGKRRSDPTPVDPNAEGKRRVAQWNALKEHDPTARKTRYNERIMKFSKVRGSAGYSDAFNDYLEFGSKAGFDALGLDPKDYNGESDASGYRSERSDLRSDDEPRGGYTIAAETFMEGLLKNVDDAARIWALSRVIAVKQARALGIRCLREKMSTWAKGTELSNAIDNLDDSIRFGRKNLTPAYFTGAARISRDLIRSSTMDIEALVYSEFARDLSYVIEAEDVSGDGDQGPLGVLVNSTDGISSARDISSSTTATTFAVETLLDAKYFLKQQYRNSARWMLHRNRIAALMKLRNDAGAGAGTGDFLWQPSVRAGEPDTICGLPVDENEFFPSGTGSGVYFGLLANWEYYIHAIALDMEILRLVETRAAYNQIEYVGRVKLDGMPVLEEAFVRLKFA
jgi:HK97 family phage major capsid protein